MKTLPLIIILSILLNNCTFKSSYSIFQNLNTEDLYNVSLIYSPINIDGDSLSLSYKHYNFNSNEMIQDSNILIKEQLNNINTRVYYEINIGNNDLPAVTEVLNNFLSNAKLKLSKSSKTRYIYKNEKYKNMFHGNFAMSFVLKETSIKINLLNCYSQNELPIIVTYKNDFNILGIYPKGTFSYASNYNYLPNLLDEEFKNLYNELAKYKNRQMINSLKPSDNRDTLQLFPLLE